MRALLFVLATGCAVETSTTNQPIIGGQDASTTTYKTVVALEETPGNWFCTGTLIDKDWVLTAAHCVTGESEETPPVLHIRFDADEINSGTAGTAVAVSEVHFNPGYNENDWDNDIAVVRLAASQTDRAPTPVHRPNVAFGTMVTQVGYGDADDNGHGAGTLRKLDTPTVDCAMAADPTVSNDNLLCFNAHDGDTSCYGDSGGPAFVNGEVAGITSGGTGNRCSQGWDLFTSVAAEIAFVDQYVPVVGATTGSGSDTGSDSTGTGGETGSGGGDTHDGTSKDGGGCNAGGGRSGVVIAFAGLLALRRRKTR